MQTTFWPLEKLAFHQVAVDVVFVGRDEVVGRVNQAGKFSQRVVGRFYYSAGVTHCRFDAIVYQVVFEVMGHSPSRFAQDAVEIVVGVADICFAVVERFGDRKLIAYMVIGNCPDVAIGKSSGYQAMPIIVGERCYLSFFIGPTDLVDKLIW